MSDAPTFDIVIPTFDRPGMLVEAVESAVAQDADGVRVTVADNTSGPETAQALERFGDRVRYVRFDEHLPYQRNMSRAKDLIEAPFGLVLHDDDVLDPDYVSVALVAFERHPDVGMVVQNVRPLREPGAPDVPFVSTYRWALALGHEERAVSGPAGQELLLPPGALREGLGQAPWMCPYWPAVSLRSSAYRAAGAYDPDIRTLIDVDMWMRVGDRHAVLLIDSIHCSYRFHAGSKSAEYQSVAEDTFVRDVLHIHAKERAGRAGWTWTDDEAARWLSFVLHRVVTRSDAECAALYDELDLASHGVPLRELQRLQLNARLLWRRTLAPDRGLTGVIADLLTRIRARRLTR